MKLSYTPVHWYLVFGAILAMAFLTSALTPAVQGYNPGGLNNHRRLQYEESTATRAPTAPGDATATITAGPVIIPTNTPAPAESVIPTDTSTPTATLTPTSTPRPTATPLPTPRGDTPETARVPMFVKPPYCIEEMCPGAQHAPPWNGPGGWTWLEPHASTWYKLHGGRMQVLIWLFANGQRGVTFDVYAPDQKDLYGKPVGRGSFNPSQQPADLFYSGRTQAGGIWYVRVNNSNPFPVAYSLRYTTALPSLGNVCNDCHRVLGDLMFDRCVSGNNSTFCDDLRWLYEQNPTQFDHSIPGR